MTHFGQSALARSPLYAETSAMSTIVWLGIPTVPTNKEQAKSGSRSSDTGCTDECVSC
jgi:hypothetical protein